MGLLHKNDCHLFFRNTFQFHTSKIHCVKYCRICTTGIYLFKVNNRSARARCEICSKLTIKTPERRRTLSRKMSAGQISLTHFLAYFTDWCIYETFKRVQFLKDRLCYQTIQSLQSDTIIITTNTFIPCFKLFYKYLFFISLFTLPLIFHWLHCVKSF